MLRPRASLLLTGTRLLASRLTIVHRLTAALQNRDTEHRKPRTLMSVLQMTVEDCLPLYSMLPPHHTVLPGVLPLGKQGKHRSSLDATALVSCLGLHLRTGPLHKPVPINIR